MAGGEMVAEIALDRDVRFFIDGPALPEIPRRRPFLKEIVSLANVRPQAVQEGHSLEKTDNDC